MDQVDPALEAQQLLAEASLDSIFEAYDEAVVDGFERPVIMLIDCEDELGAQISRAWLGDETVDEAIAVQAAAADESADESADDGDGDGDEPTTVFVAAFTLEHCQAEVPKVFPYLSEVFENPPSPDEGVLIVSVTSGGASALTAPMDARS